MYLIILCDSLPLCCGGLSLNSFDDLSADVLGHAGLVYEFVLVCIRIFEMCSFSVLDHILVFYHFLIQVQVHVCK